MVYIKKSSGTNKKPREVFTGKLVGISSDEKGLIDEKQGLFNNIDLLFIEVDEKFNDLHKGVKDDGSPKPVWRKVRVYPSIYDMTKKESVPQPLSSFKNFSEIDKLISIEKAKAEGVERVFPIVSMEVYKTLNESKEGIIYKNYKASGVDLGTIKLVNVDSNVEKVISD